ncbi:MAG: hypothetical protein IK020_02955 [Clostridiales bacterium]|nr:hypothetical protein [Clostridiales bacterium]
MTGKITSPRFVSAHLAVDILLSLTHCVTMVSLEILGAEYFGISNVSYMNLLATCFMCITFVFIRRLRIPQLLMIGLHLAASIIYLIGFYYLVLRGSEYAPLGVVYMGICVFVLFIHSMKHRWQKITEQVSIDSLLFTMALHVVLLFCMTIMGFLNLTFYIFLDAIFIVALHFAARQLDIFERRYYHNLHSATQPVKNIKRQNHFTIVVVIGGVLFALFMLLFMPVDAITTAVQSVVAAVLGFINWIINLLNRLTSFGDDQFQQEGESLSDLISQNSEPSAISRIITTILLVIISVALFTLIVISLQKLIKQFRNASGEEKIVENDAVVDIIEEVPKKKRTSGKHLDFGTGNDAKIRRQYYHAVTRAMRKGLVVKASSSARQIESRMKETGDPSISELTSRYESARYNKRSD